MIVFFDVLVLDDDICLKKPHRERRLLLKRVIQTIDGRAGISEQQVLDFSQPDSSYRLERIFTKAIAQRWEGCVLKGCDDPYFSMFQNDANNANGRWIKLKKDYIPGLGDTVDLALIGAKYIPRDANALKQIPNLLWTHFFIGCLVNKEAVLHIGATPRFRVMDVIDRHCASLRNVQVLNQFGEFHACNSLFTDHGFNIEYGKPNIPPMDVVFKTPFVVEMLGSGFEKPSGARYFALRFPRIVKIHWDRTFEDAASFQELQDLADKARAVTAEDNSAEQEQWSKRLKLANGKTQYIVPAGQSFSSTAASEPESEGHNESSSQDIPCAGMSELHRECANVPANPIPIHSDNTAKSRSPSHESDWQGNLLTENVNQSSHQKPGAYALAARQTYGSYWGNTENIKSSDDKAPFDNSVIRSAPAKSNEPHVDRILSTASTTPTTATKRDIHLISPLIKLPQYLCGPSSPAGNHNHLSKTTYQADNFLQGLTTQYHNSNTRILALGLVFLDPNASSLGPELLNIINSVSERLRRRIHEQLFPPNGKIFFLDSNVRDLGDGPEDPRFCLRATWKNISEAYFYACVSWTTTAATPYIVGTKNKLRDFINETPLTSGLGHNMTPADTPTSTSKQSTVPSTNISVRFEKEELAFLGELVSIEP